MNNHILCGLVRSVFSASPDNTIHLPAENTDVPVLEEPLLGIADADDPLFDDFKNNPDAIGSLFMTPHEWLTDARSVIVLFFPYSEEIRSRLRSSKEVIAEAWKYGYPAGSTLAKQLTIQLKEQLEAAGIAVTDPQNDPRRSRKSLPAWTDGEEDLHFQNTWSTRHAAFAAGLGTFGMHRHLITEKGACGSLGVLIADHPFTPTQRSYTDIYEYCIRCGKCAVNCPAQAMGPSGLRNLKKCSAFGAYLKEQYGGGGCGRCMAGVPCEHRNPSEH